MTARIAFSRLVHAGKEFVRDIFKTQHHGTRVKAKYQVLQHQKGDVQQHASQQPPRFVHSKSTLFSKIIPRVYYQSLASELRRQAAQRSWGRGSTPLLAFAGLAVLSSFKNEEEIVMDQIRELGKTSQGYKSSFELKQFPHLSLDCFQIGKMIGHGCNAAVYEAKLKVQSILAPEEDVVDETKEDDSLTDISMADQSEKDTESIIAISDQSDSVSEHDITVLDQSDSSHESSPAEWVEEDVLGTKDLFISLNFGSDGRDNYHETSETDSDSDIIMIDQSESGIESIVVICDKSDPESKVESTVLDQSDDDKSAPVECLERDALGITEFRISLSLDSVAADDHLGDLELSTDQNSFVILPQTDNGENAGHFEYETAPPDYNLAIKIMYNYGIESNASAILREMEKEMVPAKLAATQAQMKEWENGHKVKKKNLPPHPNIVDMWSVFVDPFPQLPEGLEHYPAALPKRLNPDGIGRNQTLFLVMKRYDMNLHQYLQTRQPDVHTRILLLAQLLEGVVHMGKYGIAHRDMKSDNILLDCSTGETPQLVIGDFGCCLASSQYGLKLPYQTEEVDRGGNTALMAPEISTAIPGHNHVLDYSKSDLWSVGALAYEIFSQDNPFYSNKGGKKLDSWTYRESDLPLLPDSVPHTVRKLVSSLLHRDPSKRPTPEIASDVLSLYLWAPPHWWLPGSKVRSQAVRWWLAVLAAEISVLRLNQCKFTPEFILKATFLSHLCMENVQAAIDLIQMG